VTTTVHVLQGPPPAALAAALARFEAQFDYPLGPGRRFRIDHGEDTTRFFRAMGEGASFVAERDGAVLGVIGASLRRLVLPGGEERPVVYIGDLKIAPEARGGRALPRLAAAVLEWVDGRASAAYSVVMDGTASSPARTTGRLGIPTFVVLGTTAVLRLSLRGGASTKSDALIVDASRGEALHRTLSAHQVVVHGGDAAVRSAMTPLWLASSGDGACGRLEDTERAKRLIDDAGVPMRSAHVSRFAYVDRDAAVALLRSALHRAAARGLPAMFVAVPRGDVEYLSQRLDGFEVVLAPATLHGFGIEPGLHWNLDTSEI
jgi:hypothetical protein